VKTLKNSTMVLSEKRRSSPFNPAFILETSCFVSRFSSEASGLFPMTSFRYATAVE
jgi:hypothetical protein